MYVIWEGKLFVLSQFYQIFWPVLQLDLRLVRLYFMEWNNDFFNTNDCYSPDSEDEGWSIP